MYIFDFAKRCEMSRSLFPNFVHSIINFATFRDISRHFANNFATFRHQLQNISRHFATNFAKLRETSRHFALDFAKLKKLRDISQLTSRN